MTPADAADNPSRTRKRPLLKRRRFWVILVLLIGGIFGAWTYLTSSQRIAAMAASRLTEVSGFPASVGGARFDVSGRIDLYDVRLRSPVIEGEMGELFHDPHVVIHFDPMRLAEGLVPERIVFSDLAMLRITEDVADGRFNFELPETDAPGPDEQMRLPEIDFQRLVVETGVVDRQTYLKLGRMPVSLVIAGRPGEPGGYKFALKELVDAAGVEPLTLTGEMDLREQTGEAELGGFAFGRRHAEMLPREMRRWWRQVDPEGQIPAIHFAYTGETGLTSKIELSDVGLTLPPLTDASRRIRMERVSGQIRFDRDGVHLDQTGDVEGFRYTIRGSAEALGTDAPFDLAVNVAPGRIPANPTYLVALPLEVQDFFYRFLPSGRIAVSARIWRETRGGEARYSGTARLSEARGRYFKVPYPLEDVSGVISFDNEKVVLHNLTGRHTGGGEVVLSGTVKPPEAEYPDVRIRVQAKGVPLDESLYTSLKPRHRRVIRKLFDRHAHQSFVEAGFIRDAVVTERAETELARLRQALLDATAPDRREALNKAIAAQRRLLALPRFDLGGVVNLDMTIFRPGGADHDADTEVSLSLQSGNIMFTRFPYPVRVVGGQVDITNNKVDLAGVRVEGLYGGEGRIEGILELPTPDHPESDLIRLAVSFDGLPLAEPLVEVIGVDARRWYDLYQPAGVLNVAGTYDTTRAGGPDPSLLDLGVRLRDGRLSVPDSDMKIEKINAAINLRDSSLTVTQSEAEAAGGRVQLMGAVDWGEEATPVRAAIAASGEALDVDAGWVGLLKSLGGDVDRIETEWNQAKPTGRFAFDASWRNFEDDGPTLDEGIYELTLKPEELTLTYENRRLSLKQTSGAIIVTQDGVDLDEFRGTLPDVGFTLDGQLTRDRSIDMDLTIDANATAGLTDDLRHVLPGQVGRLFDQIDARGVFAVREARLRHRPDVEQGLRTHFTGKVAAKDLSCRLGVEISKFGGEITIDAKVPAGDQVTTYRVDVAADKAIVMDREITKLRAKMVNDADGKHLLVPEIVGRTCSGNLGGKGWVGLDDGLYQFQLNLANADLRDVLPPQPGDPEDAYKGRLSARLAIEGNFRKEKDRRARGDLTIDRATLYDLPLSLGLLELTHLKLPTSRSFSRGRITYLMRGDQIDFQRLALETEDVRLSGGGEMDLNSRKIDLRLTSSKLEGGEFGALGELIDGIRNQFITIHVTGTLDKPETEVKALDLIREGVEDVFGE